MKTLLSKKEPEKKMTMYLKRHGGRNSTGRITVWHKGGGVKRLYRILDFGQEKINLPAKVIALEYDPNRTTYISLLEYQDGTKKYRLAPQNLKVGDEIMIAEKTEIKIGNRMKLKNIPVGTQVFDVEIDPGKGGMLARSSGATAIVTAQEGDFTHLKMPSSEIRKISGNCFASIGQASNAEYRFITIGKAGRTRHKGIRPTVRGKAMNPPDHPHGGGEGKNPIGLKHPKTPWGKPALGVKTRGKKWTDKFIIQRRQK